jgi:orotate phosphoribosyltransferase
MTSDEVLQIFRDTGALLEGHFVLRSGLHSREYFQCALALQQMPVVEKLGEALAGKVEKFETVTVIAPAIGGLVIGQEVARQRRARFIFTEKEDGKLVLRRGFKIEKGEKILVVEDVVTKGGRVQETIDIVHAHGGYVVGVATIVDRSNGTVKFGVPFVSREANRSEQQSNKGTKKSFILCYFVSWLLNKSSTAPITLCHFAFHCAISTLFLAQLDRLNSYQLQILLCFSGFQISRHTAL